MKSVPLKELKENLSQVTESAANGEVVEITRYNKPFVYITSASHPNVHHGINAGRSSLVTLGKSASQGKYLKFLKEDRDEKGVP